MKRLRIRPSSIKVNENPDIDFSCYDFVPFIMESCGGVGQAALRLCKEIEDRLEAKEYWQDKQAGARELRKFPDPLLTAINVEVQRYNSRMILERQPPRENLIETAFIKCKAEIEKKKMKAAKSVKRGFNRWPKYNINVNSNGVSSSAKDRISSGCSSLIKPNDEKWPPDPPKADNSLNNQVHSDNVSLVELPLAIIKDSNSHLVSTSTKALVSVLKERNENETRLIPKLVFRRKEGKDPDAIEWEPPMPMLRKKHRTWENNSWRTESSNGK